MGRTSQLTSFVKLIGVPDAKTQPRKSKTPQFVRPRMHSSVSRAVRQVAIALCLAGRLAEVLQYGEMCVVAITLSVTGRSSNMRCALMLPLLSA